MRISIWRSVRQKFGPGTVSYVAREIAEPPYIKLPPLDNLACILVGDDDDELGDLAADHPLVELAHDLFYVCLDLVVGGDWAVS